MKTSVYYQTWSSPWVGTAALHDIVHIDSRISQVILSFADPNTTYSKRNSFSGTGLNFSSDFAVVKEAIAILKKKRNVQVLLGVGGATYQFNYSSPAKPCVDLAYDLGCDGIDIDWEPSRGAEEDAQFGLLIQKYRTALWSNAFLSAAVFGSGAYPKDGGLWNGLNIKGLKSHGSLLNEVHLMAYDAGPPPPNGGYDPLQAYSAFKLYYPGAILFGFEPGPMGWGSHILSEAEVITNSKAVAKNSNDGIFIWALQKDTSGSPSVDRIITLVNANTVALPSTSPVTSGADTTWKLDFKCPNCAKVFLLK